MIPLLLTLSFALAQDAPPTEAQVEAPVEPPAEPEDAEPEEEAPAAVPEPEPEPEPAPKPDPEPPAQPEPQVFAPPPMPEAGAGPDHVAKWSLSAEIGGSAYRDDSFDLFGSRDGLDTSGLRVGRRVVDRVEVQLGWLRGNRGANVEVANAAGGREFAFQSAYYAHRFSLGARGDVTLDNALFAYVAARGQLVLQQVRLDGDPDSKSNVDQLSETALAPGGELVGGIELRIPQGEMPLTAGWTLEVGAETVANATFGEFGDLRSGGFVIHSGIGIRF